MTRAKLYFGLGIGIMLLCAVLLLEGTALSLINLPGLVLVIGGTYLASVIAHGNGAVVDLLSRLPSLFRASAPEDEEQETAFLRVADYYRRGDIRSAERMTQRLTDPFLRDGARLALDPRGGDELMRMLRWRIRECKERSAAEVRVFRTMATFAPAFGMLGTLLGLVSLLDDLATAGLEQIGMSMGFTLMSTLYGLLLANLLFRPLALKLEGRSRARINTMGFWLDALLMLYERRHARAIGDYLQSREPSAAPIESPKRALNVRRIAFGRT